MKDSTERPMHLIKRRSYRRKFRRFFLQLGHFPSFLDSWHSRFLVIAMMIVMILRASSTLTVTCTSQALSLCLHGAEISDMGLRPVTWGWDLWHAASSSQPPAAASSSRNRSSGSWSHLLKVLQLEAAKCYSVHASCLTVCPRSL